MILELIEVTGFSRTTISTLGGFKLLAHASVVPNVPREACDSEVFFGVGDSAGAGPPAPWSIQPG